MIETRKTTTVVCDMCNRNAKAFSRDGQDDLSRPDLTRVEVVCVDATEYTPEGWGHDDVHLCFVCARAVTKAYKKARRELAELKAIEKNEIPF